MNIGQAPPAPATARRFPGYNAVWRWHFYAGLLCIPFVLWLATTGAFYLFKPQVEALIDRPYAAIATPGPRATPSVQVDAAIGAVPGTTLRQYELPATPSQAVQVVVGGGTSETRVYVHPQTLKIVKSVDEDSRLMNIVFRLHGELLIGTPGSYIVELAASWAIVMIVSGLYLWWPRGGSGMAGILYPRLDASGRRFWRDLHAVTGFWVSIFALILLLSGLPWAKNWGSYLKTVRSAVAGSPVAKPDWSTGTADKLAARAALPSASDGQHDDHVGMAGMEHMAGMAIPSSYAALDRVVATAVPLALAAPVIITPPKTAGETWTVKSDAANRPLRVDLEIDGNTGALVSRKDFAQRTLLDRILGYGIAAHEGQLFGWINQLLNLAVAVALILLSVSSVMMWWRRRPADTLGAPVALARPAVDGVFVAILVALGIFLPLLGASMVVVLLVEHFILRRMPGASRWLGLPAAAQRGSAAS